MAGPRVSVIVPVYNTAQWLTEAFDSIEHQPRRAETEVIVIDDGSTDDSARIAQSYAARAAAVRYVRQDNAGLGAARNHGVRLATGRYLAFLDSDDIYPDGALDELVRLAEVRDAMIAVGDMQGLPPRPNPPWRRELVTGERVIDRLEAAPDLAGNPSACNKVFRRDFVTANHAQFTEHTSFEDVLFTVPLLVRSPRTVLTPRLAYLYRQRGDGTSLMDSRSQPLRIMQHLAIVERLAETTVDAPAVDRAAVLRWIACMQVHYAWRAAGALDDEQLAVFTDRMSALFKEIPIDTVSEFISNAGAGLRAAAIYEQDLGSMRSPRTTGPLRVHAGQPYLGHPRFATYRDLLRIRDITVSLLTLTPDPQDEQQIIIDGVCACAGIAGDPGQVRQDLFLEIGDGLARQPLVTHSISGHRMRWRCRLPVGALGAGRHLLRVVVRDQGREFTIPFGPERGGKGTHGTRPVRLGAGRTGWLTPSATGRRSIQMAVARPALVLTDGPAGTLAHSPRWIYELGVRRGRTLPRTARATLARVRDAVRRGRINRS